MTDIVGTARSAREMLARGLGALQSDPNAPAEFLSAAEPIAMAMGALHRIERSGGADLVAAAPQALENVRAALSLLQSKAGTDGRFQAVLEEVAGSLGMVFTLTKAASYGPAPAQPAPVQPAPVQPAAPYSPPPAAQQPFAAPAQPMRPAMQPQPQPQPQPAYAPPAQAFAPQPQPQPQPQQAHQVAPWQQQPQPAPQPAYAQPAPAYPQAPAAPQAVPAYGPPPQQAFAQQPYAPPQQPYAPPQQAQPYAPPQQAFAQQQPAPQQAPQPAQPVAASGYRDADKLPLIEAELGTHSVSNFYRGLSGNDIIENGGIFVSTYNIPEIGQRLRLRVSLPGGLEFEALGVVRWVREARESMASDISPPGFGLQFTNISAEGRNLVYRYVRNREPMFHDDL